MIVWRFEFWTKNASSREDDLLRPRLTTPEKFENGDFTQKMHQKLSAHEIWKRNNQRDYRNVIVFAKLSFQNVNWPRD